MSLAAEQGWLSPSDIALTGDGSAAVLACDTADSILLFDLKEEKVKSAFVVKGVRELALSSDERRI